jgi:hypothetical protein
MTKEEDYRRYASDSLQMAQRAPTTDERGRLLQMAEAWLDLADRAAQAIRNLRKSKGAVHPLVREKFGPHIDD